MLIGDPKLRLGIICLDGKRSYPFIYSPDYWATAALPKAYFAKPFDREVQSVLVTVGE